MLRYPRVARRIASGITLDRLLEDETTQLALTKRWNWSASPRRGYRPRFTISIRN